MRSGQASMARPTFLALLEDPCITVIIVEHKDRASRFGERFIESLLRIQGRTLEVVNQAENGTEDLLTDLTSIISSFVLVCMGNGEHSARRNALCKN